jgi:hypothetical protein
LVVLKVNAFSSLLMLFCLPALAQNTQPEPTSGGAPLPSTADSPGKAKDHSVLDARPSIAPDIREDETLVKLRRGDFVAVPIPISDPTLGDGLVAGGAYFYPQSAEQAKQQPASMTAAAGLATTNGSRAFGLAQQNYWFDNRWRFTGAVGMADLRLSLLTPEDDIGSGSLDWRVNGEFLYAKLARRLTGNWYGGGFVRAIDASQSFESNVESMNFDTGLDILSVGPGLLLEYDSRDNPFNSTKGRYVTVDGLFNDESLGSDSSYQSYSAAYRSYHAISDDLVLALDAQGCRRVGAAPLWDSCTLKLRGFPATDYLGRSSSSIQSEARWQLSERWGVVAFAGGGYVGKSFSERDQGDLIPSYGAGVRFMVLQEKRINLRVDYSRSAGSEALYISVGEAF